MLQHRSNRMHFLRKHVRMIAAMSAGFLLIVVVLVLALASPVQANAPAAPAAPTPPPCTDGIQGYVLNELHLPLSGWTVEAYPKGNPAAKLTTVTNGEGYFEFSPIAAGDWVVNLVPVAGWVPVPPTQMTVEVTVGAGADCAEVFFKMQQATPTPTATWTPGPPATRLRGYVYEFTCDGMVPLANVTLNAWRSDLPDNLDNLVKTVQTDGGGFYNFYLPTTPPPYYHIIVEPPPGFVAYQATSLEGYVVDVDHIRINSPGYMVYEDNNFILKDPDLQCETPTPTPTPTETPTSTPTPTPTDTPTPTPTPTPYMMFMPMIMQPGGVCEVGRLNVELWGRFYSFPLKPDGNVKTIPPIPWGDPTTFHVVNYEGPVTWTQYAPYYHKQVGGYEFTYPGTSGGLYAGDDFHLFVRTDCGTIFIDTAIDDPTPTPSGPEPTATPTPEGYR